MNKLVYLYFCVSLSLFSIIIPNFIILTFAESPKFSEQEISDPRNDWVNMKTTQEDHMAFGVPDITTVDYSSDGKFLNATMWLFKPFKEHPKSFTEVDYGMFIDSDFNSKTGFGGIDYKIEIGWDNDTNLWTKKVERWGHYDTYQKTIENITNYTGFYEQNANYVTLSANLDKILNPDKYKVIFYADSRKANGDLIIDYTRYVAIPPIELTSYTTPGSVELTQGETKNIVIRLNSTLGYVPLVDVKAEIPDKKITPTFEFSNGNKISNFTVPSDGKGIIRLKISADRDAPLGPSLLLISANSNFPPGQLLKISGVQPVYSNNVNSNSTVSLLIDKEPDDLEKLSNLWDKIGGFTSFLYGVLAGISPFIYTQIKKKLAGEQPKQTT
jgi:hypothetical protein